MNTTFNISELRVPSRASRLDIAHPDGIHKVKTSAYLESNFFNAYRRILPWEILLKSSFSTMSNKLRSSLPFLDSIACRSFNASDHEVSSREAKVVGLGANIDSMRKILR
jgi:hypothetical protein